MLARLLLVLGLILANFGPASAQMVNAQTGTTYTFVNTDCDQQGIKLVTFNSATAVAVTLPQAGANNQFTNGCVISAQNLGVGLVTITPTTSTINGASSLTLATGQSVRITNNSYSATTGNYFAQLGNAVGAIAANPVGAQTAIFGSSVPIVTRWDSVGAPVAGGSNYALGDVITLSSGTKVTVSLLSGNAVAGFYINTPATLSSFPAQPETQVSTTGSGTGATFNILYAPISGTTQFETGAGVPYGVNSLLRVGYQAGWGTRGNGILNGCFGDWACGSGTQTGDGLGGGTGMTAGENTGIGNIALSQCVGCLWITAVGHNAAGHEVNGVRSVYMGTDAGKYSVNNSDNVFTGVNSAKFALNAFNNVGVGEATLGGNGLQPTVTGAANNGSGLIRLTLSSTSGMSSGDAIFVGAVGGTTEANTTGSPWYATVIDGTHVDLQGSAFVHAYTSGGAVVDAQGGFDNISISGTQSNGGLIELLLPHTNGLRTGNVVHVANVQGTTEANGTWTITVRDYPCNSGCRVDLQGSTFTNAYVSGGQLTYLVGPQSTVAAGYAAASGATGAMDNAIVIGSQTAQNATGLIQDVFIGPGIAGTAGPLTQSVVLVGSGLDVLTNNVTNAVAIGGGGVKVCSNSVQVGYRATFQNNTTTGCSAETVIGQNAGFSLTTASNVTLIGNSVGQTNVKTGNNIMLLGTNGSCDQPTTGVSNYIGLCAGSTPVISVTGAATPSTSVVNIAGVLQMGTAFAANGAVATALTAIGPTGSHATVQEWMQVTNSTGTVRYIPLF